MEPRGIKCINLIRSIFAEPWRLPTLAQATTMQDMIPGLIALMPNINLSPLQRMQFSGHLFIFCDAYVTLTVMALQNFGSNRGAALKERQLRATAFQVLAHQLGELAERARDLYLLEQSQAIQEAVCAHKEAEANAGTSIQAHLLHMAMKIPLKIYQTYRQGGAKPVRPDKPKKPKKPMTAKALAMRRESDRLHDEAIMASYLAVQVKLCR